MSIITPSDTALAHLAELNIGQQRFDLSELSDTTGHTATRLGGPPRWTVSLRTLDAMEPAVAALWKAIAVQLRGRVNHLAVYDVSQSQPRGTARGNITLSSSAAAGDTTLQLSGSRGLNYVLGGSFEVDSNADGLADGWTRYSQNNTGALSASLSTTAVAHGTYSQQLTAAVLGNASTDRSGIRQGGIPVTALAGQSVTLACQVSANSGTGVALYLAYFDATNDFISDSAASATATGAAQTVSAVSTCPPSAVTAEVFVYQHSGAGVVATLRVDAVRLVAGTTAPTYPASPTLLQGDWLQVGSGVGSHYCLVTADATANDAGAITVTIEPPLRKAFTSGTAVTWDKPRGHFKQRPDSVSWSGVAGGAGAGGFAFDLMEDWSA